MTIEQLRRMEPRERDALVAEKVMGWRRTFDGWLTPYGWAGKLSFCSDVAWDHDVLRHVRETWDESAQWRFVGALAKILRIYDVQWTTYGTLHGALFGNGDAKGLQVGDYSLAALAAVLPEAADAGEGPK